MTKKKNNPKNLHSRRDDDIISSLRATYIFNNLLSNFKYLCNFITKQTVKKTVHRIYKVIVTFVPFKKYIKNDYSSNF